MLIHVMLRSCSRNVCRQDTIPSPQAFVGTIVLDDQNEAWMVEGVGHASRQLVAEAAILTEELEAVAG